MQKWVGISISYFLGWSCRISSSWCKKCIFFDYQYGFDLVKGKVKFEIIFIDLLIGFMLECCLWLILWDRQINKCKSTQECQLFIPLIYCCPECCKYCFQSVHIIVCSIYLLFPSKYQFFTDAKYDNGCERISGNCV